MSFYSLIRHKSEWHLRYQIPQRQHAQDVTLLLPIPIVPGSERSRTFAPSVFLFISRALRAFNYNALVFTCRLVDGYDHFGHCDTELDPIDELVADGERQHYHQYTSLGYEMVAEDARE